jgi:Na+/H+ antiporter NhaD/arsenite permease-like protein
MESAALPIIVFLVVYAAVTLELVHRAVAALAGVSVLVILHVVSEHQAIELIDAETLMLLTGMMIIVSVLRKSGFFTIVSIKIAEFTRGSPVKILILFSVVTASMSAFLDNVTTVLIVVPIIIELTRGLGLDPKRFVISQALISNIAGTATLIGDPPNIIIGSKVGLTFNQFILNLSIPVVVALIAALLYLWATHREDFRPIHTNLVKLFSVQLLLEKIRFEFMDAAIDRKLMFQGLACLGLAIFLFISQTLTGFSPGVSALSVAMLLLLITRTDVDKVLEEVEWSTLMFFAGLFILVGALEEHGVIQWMAQNVFMQVGDEPHAVVLTVLWVSGIASGFLDNIPFTITMIPIVELMLESNPVPNDILWWALALGACLGGNITMIGSSANIVAVGIASSCGVKVGFAEFMKVGAAIAAISLTLSSLYLIGYLWVST